jgi:hypothetical protein
MSSLLRAIDPHHHITGLKAAVMLLRSSENICHENTPYSKPARTFVRAMEVVKIPLL